MAKTGPSALIWSGVGKTVLFIFVSPILGFVLGAALMIAVSWLCNRTSPRRVDKIFRRLQLLSAAAYSLGHGGNDAQKTIGIIWMLLIAAGMSKSGESVPVWVIGCCYLSMGLGTMFGGWRIVRTMGQRITKLNQASGFCANSGGALTLFLATYLGIPVSTTHTITGAITGVGATHGTKKVRWGVAGGIVWAWVLTIPASAMMAAIAWYVGRAIL
jgi:PiT family inorganic phosphate transporter